MAVFLPEPNKLCFLVWQTRVKNTNNGFFLSTTLRYIRRLIVFIYTNLGKENLPGARDVSRLEPLEPCCYRGRRWPMLAFQVCERPTYIGLREPTSTIVGLRWLS